MQPAPTAQPAAHRQTRYESAPRLDPPVVLPIPELTRDLDQARRDLTDTGMCLLEGVLDMAQVERLRERLEAQAAAERGLGELAPPEAAGVKQALFNLPNKGRVFLDLVEHEVSDVLGGYLLGKDFLISSVTGGLFHGPTSEPQPLHRDQGQVPATADFPAACNLFWLLDDFTPARGSTCVVPGSHRWAPEYLVKPPPRELSSQIEAPAGSVFCWDGRMFHGTGVNSEGHPRRHIVTFYCLPWMRQQENWGVSCLQEVLDEASDKLKVRLGLRTYGTLGGVNGTRTAGQQMTLGNAPVVFPDYIIGENGTLHPVRRVRRSDVAGS